MTERINVVYGQVDENKQGIVEFRFDSKIWDSKKTKDLIILRRKTALTKGEE
jgi:hypothetical protein